MTPSAVPTDKVTAAGLGGAVAVVLLALLGVVGVDVAALPVGVEAALATVVAFAAGYLRSERGEVRAVAHGDRGAIGTGEAILIAVVVLLIFAVLAGDGRF